MKIFAAFCAGAIAISISSLLVQGSRAADVTSSLDGSDWISIVPGCDIREMTFTTDTAVIKLMWNSAGAHWTNAGNQIQFDLDEWDGKLTGTLISENELDLSFDWKTTDYMPHSARCAMSRKPQRL